VVQKDVVVDVFRTAHLPAAKQKYLIALFKHWFFHVSNFFWNIMMKTA